MFKPGAPPPFNVGEIIICIATYNTPTEDIVCEGRTYIVTELEKIINAQHAYFIRVADALTLQPISFWWAAERFVLCSTLET